MVEDPTSSRLGFDAAKSTIHAPNAPLAPQARELAERSLGVDLGGVRVWQGAAAERSNERLGSRAFTLGQDIVLGPGVENGMGPVLAHEIAHTVQQRGAVRAAGSRSPLGAAGSPHEAEADHAAQAIVRGQPARVSPVGGIQIQRAPATEQPDATKKKAEAPKPTPSKADVIKARSHNHDGIRVVVFLKPAREKDYLEWGSKSFAQALQHGAGMIEQTSEYKALAAGLTVATQGALEGERRARHKQLDDEAKAGKDVAKPAKEAAKAKPVDPVLKGIDAPQHVAAVRAREAAKVPPTGLIAGYCNALFRNDSVFENEGGQFARARSAVAITALNGGDGALREGQGMPFLRSGNEADKTNPLTWIAAVSNAVGPYATAAGATPAAAATPAPAGAATKPAEGAPPGAPAHVAPTPVTAGTTPAAAPAAAADGPHNIQELSIFSHGWDGGMELGSVPSKNHRNTNAIVEALLPYTRHTGLNVQLYACMTAARAGGLAYAVAEDFARHGTELSVFGHATYGSALSNAQGRAIDVDAATAARAVAEHAEDPHRDWLRTPIPMVDLRQGGGHDDVYDRVFPPAYRGIWVVEGKRDEKSVNDSTHRWLSTTLNPEGGSALAQRAKPLGIEILSLGLPPTSTIGFAREETLAGLRALWEAECFDWLEPIPVFPLYGPLTPPRHYKPPETKKK